MGGCGDKPWPRWLAQGKFRSVLGTQCWLRLRYR